MRREKLEWDPRPPNRRERLMAGLWLAVALPVMASYFAGWRLFGDHDKPVAAVLGLGGLVLMQFVPGVKRADPLPYPVAHARALGDEELTAYREIYGPHSREWIIARSELERREGPSGWRIAGAIILASAIVALARYWRG
jgi:hypothetical protein